MSSDVLLIAAAHAIPVIRAGVYTLSGTAVGIAAIAAFLIGVVTGSPRFLGYDVLGIGVGICLALNYIKSSRGVRPRYKALFDPKPGPPPAAQEESKVFQTPSAAPLAPANQSDVWTSGKICTDTFPVRWASGTSDDLIVSGIKNPSCGAMTPLSHTNWYIFGCIDSCWNWHRGTLSFHASDAAYYPVFWNVDQPSG